MLIIIAIIVVVIAAVYFSFFSSWAKRGGSGEKIENMIEFHDHELTTSVINSIPDINQLITSANVIRTVGEIDTGMECEDTQFIVDVSGNLPKLSAFLCGMTFLNYISTTRQDISVCAVLAKKHPHRMLNLFIKWFPKIKFITRLPPSKADIAVLCYDDIRPPPCAAASFVGNVDNITMEYFAYLPPFSNARQLPVHIIIDSAAQRMKEADMRWTHKERVFYYHFGRRQYGNHPMIDNEFGLCSCADCAITMDIFSNFAKINTEVTFAKFCKTTCKLARCMSLKEKHITERKFASRSKIISSIKYFIDVQYLPAFTELAPWNFTLSDANKYAVLKNAIMSLYGKKVTANVFRRIIRGLMFGMSKKILLTSLYKLATDKNINVLSIYGFIIDKKLYPPLTISMDGDKVHVGDDTYNFSCYKQFDIAYEKYALYVGLFQSFGPTVVQDDRFCQTIDLFMMENGFKSLIVISVFPVIRIDCSTKHTYYFMCEHYIPTHIPKDTLILIHSRMMDDTAKRVLIDQFSSKNAMILLTIAAHRGQGWSAFGSKISIYLDSYDLECKYLRKEHTIRGIGKINNENIAKYFAQFKEPDNLTQN